MDSISHIVRREFVDLMVLGSEAEGFALQHTLGELCGSWLTRALDDAFARNVPDDEHWIVDRLEVDAGCFTPADFERDFVQAVAKAVGARIQACVGTFAGHDVPGPGAWRKLSGGESVQQAWLHFLATGMLPWWFRLTPPQTLEQALDAAWRLTPPSGAVLSGFVELMREPAVRLRLHYQFSAAFVDTVLRRVSPTAATALHNFIAEAARHADARRTLPRLAQQARLAALDCMAARRPVTIETLVAHLLRPILRDEHAGSDDASAAARTLGAIASALGADTQRIAAAGHRDDAGHARKDDAADTPRTRVDPQEPVFVDCAGIVLLHPFLPALFERLGVAADGALTDPDRALALLHCLATGETCAPEYALALPKLLCGLPIDAPAGPPAELTSEETAEAGALLNAVIGHWTALRDTSPDALRGTFLTRPGKLCARDGDDLLQVEPQSFDVLLDDLPWGIGTIRLPWMTRLLWVEWRN